MDSIDPSRAANLLNEEQAAELLLVSPRTLQDWRLRGGGPPVTRVGRLVRYQRSTLLTWFAENTAQPERPAPAPRSSPPLAAVEVAGVDGTSGHLATWCPWCERIHRHGSAGGAGNRAAHCHDLSASPFRSTGYDLDLTGPAASEAAVMPDGLMVGGAYRLGTIVSDPRGLRRELVRLILGLARSGRNVIVRRLPGGTVSVAPSHSLFAGRSLEHWTVQRKGGETVQGEGMLRLAAHLYGVPEGVAAVRILEAATAETLDAEAALGVQRVIDEWVGRGAPKRGAR